MKAKSLEISYTYQQEPRITLTVVGNIDHLQNLTNCELLEVDIKPYKEKRSLSANSYHWVLVGKIADTLRTDKHDLYIQMLRKYGQREPDLLSVVAEAVDMIYRATDNHCYEVGESILKGKTFKHLAILRGSSTYDTKEMSILLDGVVSDAKELNIETLDDIEIQRLIEKVGR